MTTRIEFWPGRAADIDLHRLAANAVSVKGVAHENPCRLLEIYGNLPVSSPVLSKTVSFSLPSPTEVSEHFLPQVPGVEAPLGPTVYQPPFLWVDCDPRHIALNFTYTTNAFYRIFKNLADAGRIPAGQVPELLDQACLLLSHVYRANEHAHLKYINNNLNMFMVSRVVERIVGRATYSSDAQEVRLTAQSLVVALAHVAEHASLELPQQMALALGQGVAFVEAVIASRDFETADEVRTQETMYRYVERPLAVDHRSQLIDRVAAADAEGKPFELCAILDDTVESVDDLLWMQTMLLRFRALRVNVLVNTAQISINFSAEMLDQVLASPQFSHLAQWLGQRFEATRLYCPLISFQWNYFTKQTRTAIDRADAVYVKGLNFFETCQLPHKDAYHAFVVYGPISRQYTGLQDFEGVFARLPPQVVGYEHSTAADGIRTLRDLVGSQYESRPRICDSPLS
jgi:hypothetical protein